MQCDSSMGSITYSFIVQSADSSCRILSLGNEQSQCYIGGHLSFFWSAWIHLSHLHSFLSTSPLVCSPEWHLHFKWHIVTQWCYWWWISFSWALTKQGFIKYVSASVLHWSMIFCSTTNWWKIQGWRQSHFPFVLYNMVFKLCLL